MTKKRSRNDRILADSFQRFCDEEAKNGKHSILSALWQKGGDYPMVEASFEVILPYTTKIDPLSRIWFDLKKDFLRVYGRSVTAMFEHTMLCSSYVNYTKDVYGRFFPNYAGSNSKEEHDVIGKDFTDNVVVQLAIFEKCLSSFIQSDNAKLYRRIIKKRRFTSSQKYIDFCEKLVDSFVEHFLNEGPRKYYWEEIESLRK